MKSLLRLPFLIITLSSCYSDKRSKLRKCPEKWQLVKMTRSTSASPLTGEGMDWQEWYLLDPDNTFTKTRNRDNQLIEESGTYSSMTLMDGKFIEFTYPSKNDLIVNCTADPVETLIAKSNGEMISIWVACDGPGLFYEKADIDCD